MLVLASAPAQGIDRLMLFGFLSAFFTLVCFDFQRQNRTTVLMFPVCLTAIAVYGFAKGAWPLGIVEVVFAAVNTRRWWTLRKQIRTMPRRRNVTRVTAMAEPMGYWHGESRMARMFGPRG